MSLDVAALACGAARSLCSPASSALPARVVEPDDLLAANSLLGVTASIGQVAGPLAASVLMAATGFRVAFAADAAMYLVNVLAVLPLPVLPQPDEPRGADAETAGRTAHGVAWLRETVAALDVPPLGAVGLQPPQYAEVAGKSARSSSMQGNPVRLDEAELVAVLEAAS